MGTTLTGTTPQDTYDSLIKVTDNGPISGTLKALSDGLGNDSTLSLSTTAASIAGTLAVAGDFSIADKIVHIGDTNTAIRFPAADTITFETSGAEALRITSAGNVGIGTSAPAAKLDVSGAFSSVLTSIISVTDTAHTYRGTPDGIGYEHAKVLSSRESVISTYGSFLAFYTESKNSGTTDTSTEKMRITSDAYLRMASGTGGIQFNGDTAAANALDDYEEGTWTMGVSFGGASVGVTYADRTGTYTKIGRQVTVNGYLNLTNKGSSTGSATITGLPFAIPNLVQNYSTANVFLVSITFANQFQAIGAINSTSISLEEITVLGTNSTITDADFANGSQIVLSFTYFV
jgi:hypothetical protein